MVAVAQGYAIEYAELLSFSIIFVGNHEDIYMGLNISQITVILINSYSTEIWRPWTELLYFNKED